MKIQTGEDMRVIEFEIPMRTPLLNEWQRMHWARRKSLAKVICGLVAAHAGAQRPPTPLKACNVIITRYSPRPPDHDGLMGGLKPLLDCLIPVSKRHPHGLGFIEDDSPFVIKLLRVTHAKAPTKMARTAIRIEEVE